MPVKIMQPQPSGIDNFTKAFMSQFQKSQDKALQKMKLDLEKQQSNALIKYREGLLSQDVESLEYKKGELGRAKDLAKFKKGLEPTIPEQFKQISGLFTTPAVGPTGGPIIPGPKGGPAPYITGTLPQGVAPSGRGISQAKLFEEQTGQIPTGISSGGKLQFGASPNILTSSEQEDIRLRDEGLNIRRDTLENEIKVSGLTQDRLNQRLDLDREQAEVKGRKTESDISLGKETLALKQKALAQELALQEADIEIKKQRLEQNIRTQGDTRENQERRNQLLADEQKLAETKLAVQATPEQARFLRSSISPTLEQIEETRKGLFGGKEKATGKIRVRRKADNKTGTIEPTEFDPKLYERL